MMYNLEQWQINWTLLRICPCSSVEWANRGRGSAMFYITTIFNLRKAIDCFETNDEHTADCIPSLGPHIGMENQRS